MSYFWHPITHNVEVPINRRLTVDLEYSNLVHKAQELCNQMNFKWVTKVIRAKQMLMNNSNMVAEGGRELEGDVAHNQDNNIGDVADEPVVKNQTDAAGYESSEVILNDTLSLTREVVTNRITQEGEENVNPADLAFQLNNLNVPFPNHNNVTQGELESTALPSIPEGGILSTSTSSVLASGSNNNKTSTTSAVVDIQESNRTTTAPAPIIPLNLSLRKMPTKWDNAEGFDLGYNILCHSQRIGWSTTLAYSKRTNYFSFKRTS